MKDLILNLIHDEEGASMVEYVLLLAVIAVVLIAGFRTVGTNAQTKLGNVGSEIAK